MIAHPQEFRRAVQEQIGAPQANGSQGAPTPGQESERR
jgi:hypothetical protein